MVDTIKSENGNGTAKQLATRPHVPEIAISSSGSLMPSNLAEAIEYAKMIAHSGMVPKQYDGNVGAVLVAIQMGAEVGLPPLASIQNIAVINGRPSLWGDAVLAVITSQPDCIDVQETSGDGWAKCVVRRRGRTPVECTFTTQDAKTAGLWGKQGPWTNYPKRMLQMRARGFACRDAYPDRLRGIHIAEEVRGYDIVEGEFSAAPQELTAGDHSFGFRPKAVEPAQVAEPVKVAEPSPAPKPITDKEKAWREKRNGKAVAATPAAEPARELSAEDAARWANMGGPPMDEPPMDNEPGSRG